MKKPAQLMMLPITANVPVTQCWSVVSEEDPPWIDVWAALMSSMAGPLYNVITIAPPTVIAVPITFARLRIFFKFTVSNLIV